MLVSACVLRWQLSTVMASSVRPLGSPPGSSVHGILQARRLEWVSVPSSSVGFYCIAKWISHKCTYTPSLLGFLPIQVSTVREVDFPTLNCVFPSAVYFICSTHGAYTSIPISQFLPPSLPPFPLVCFLHLKTLKISLMQRKLIELCQHSTDLEIFTSHLVTYTFLS